MNTRRLTKKEMWIFAVGQLGWSILSGIISAWLVAFYLPTKETNSLGQSIFSGTGEKLADLYNYSSRLNYWWFLNYFRFNYSFM